VVSDLVKMFVCRWQGRSFEERLSAYLCACKVRILLAAASLCSVSAERERQLLFVCSKSQVGFLKVILKAWRSRAVGVVWCRPARGVTDACFMLSTYWTRTESSLLPQWESSYILHTTAGPRITFLCCISVFWRSAHIQLSFPSESC
jgi:hypothetical protein